MVIIIVKVNVFSVGKFDEFVIYQIKSIMCPCRLNQIHDKLCKTQLTKDKTFCVRLPFDQGLVIVSQPLDRSKIVADVF